MIIRSVFGFAERYLKGVQMFEYFIRSDNKKVSKTKIIFFNFYEIISKNFSFLKINLSTEKKRKKKYFCFKD